MHPIQGLLQSITNYVNYILLSLDYILKPKDLQIRRLLYLLGLRGRDRFV